MKRLLKIFFFLSLGILPLGAQAGSRDHLFHQGLVFDASGTAVNGTLNVTFRLYEGATGGDPIWEEVQAVRFEEGVYTAELGNFEPFPDGIFGGETLFLGIQIEGDSEMSPRLGLFSVPWAQQAEVAITAQSLSENIVTSVSIAPGAIESSDIATGAIGPAELASTGVIPGSYTLATITVDADGRVTSAASGSVPVASGDITGVIAGTGLSGGGLSGDVTLTSVLGASIDSSEIVDGTITSADISGTAGITDGQVTDALTISGGTVNGSVIGGTTPAAGTFTALRANTNLILQDGVSGSETVTVQVPDIAAGYTLTLPVDDGTAGQVLSTDGSGALSWTSTSVGDITAVTAGTGLTGGGASGDVTLTVDVGTAAGKIVQLDGSARLPAVDGSLVTALNGSNIASGTVADARLSANVSLLGSSIQDSEVDDSITISSVAAAAITGSLTDAQVSDTLTSSIFVGSGSTTNAVDLATAEVSGTLPLANLTDGGSTTSALFAGGAGGDPGYRAIADADVPDTITINLAATATALAANGSNCASGSFPLGVDASGSAEGCTVATTGTVTSVGSSTGLTGGPITTAGTLSFDYSGTLAADPALGAGQAIFGTTGILFEGSSADTNEGLLTVVNPTADQTWTLPNTTGTIVTTGDSQTVSSAMITDGTITSGDISGTAGITDGQVNNNLTISVGTINSTPIGATTASTGAFTTLTASTSAAIGGGTAITQLVFGTCTVDPPNIANNGTGTIAVTTTTTCSPTFAAATTDVVFVTPPSTIENIIFEGANVTAANTITFKFANESGGAINGAALSWSVLILR